MDHHRHYRLLWVIFACAMASCVSIDKRIESEAIDRVKTATLSGTFSNFANYVSSADGYVVKRNLADMLFVPGYDSIEHVSLKLDADVLTIDFIKGDQSVAQRTYKKSELSTTPDGRIELPTDRSAGADAAIIGYRSEKISLFINGEGDLVALRSGGGAGTVALVVPIAVYVKHMAVFPRIR